MPAKIELDYNILYDMYHNKNMSQKELANFLNCSDQTIRKEFRRLKIETRLGPENLVGKKFGNWTVLDHTPISKTDTDTKWLCRCDCGYEKYVRRGVLKNGATKKCARCFNRLFVDISGQKIGRWTILGQKESHIGVLWECICDCGFERDIRSCEFGLLGRNGCKKCAGYSGYKDISGSYFAQTKKGAKSRDLAFSITIHEMWDKFVSQDKKCALSGVSLMLSRAYSRNAEDQTASIDRIDSSIGYVKNNIQWVHKDVNRLKNHFTEKQLFDMCLSIVKHKNLIKE